MRPGPGIEPGTHWWEASALTTAPTLLPQMIINEQVQWWGWIKTSTTTDQKTVGNPGNMPLYKQEKYKGIGDKRIHVVL